MRNILSLVAAVVLTFMAVSLLMAAIQYSGDQIGLRYQNATILSSGVPIKGANNSVSGDSPDKGGDPEVGSQGGSGSGIGSVLQSIESMTSGGKPKDPDEPPEPPNYLLIILILLAVLAVLAFIGYLVWRRRHRKTPPAPAREAAAWRIPGAFEGDYRIRFPQIREPFPAIWGEGEALEVLVERKAGAKDEVVLDIDGKAVQDVRLENGRAYARLELARGDHRITVGTRDDRAPPSWAEVRIVDYREEVIRMFNEMYLTYSSRYGENVDKMTPREMEQAIVPNIPDAKRKPLGVTVTLFELANFSLHAIRRGDFERMYLSRMDVT